ncbi:MAG: hypothetical protein IH600_15915 [Bacteroidetes bacterium]|nr:hypothetical protein [Bacteroidota bacterium]
MKRIGTYALLGLAVLLSWSCQSPLTSPPEVEQRILVLVQDEQRAPIPGIPVQLYEGTDIANRQPLRELLTDNRGAALFEVTIPASGGRYSIIAGSDRTGRLLRTVDLLCRDTTIVLTFAARNLTCGGDIRDTLWLTDVCTAPRGDSTEAQYTSTCDEPVTVTWNDPGEPASAFFLRVFDANAQSAGSGFTLPPRGSFSVRPVWLPAQEGTLQREIVFTLQGAASNSRVLLTVLGTAVDCNSCSCEDVRILLDAGSVVADSDSFRTVIEEVLENRASCDAMFELVRSLAPGRAFTLETPFNTLTLRPGRKHALAIRFTPPGEGVFSDSLVFVSTLLPDGSRCTTTVVVRGNGVLPACCVDESASDGLEIDRSVSPPVYRIRLRTDVYSETDGRICFYNCGSGGWLTISRPAVPAGSQFSIPEQRHTLRARSEGGGNGCFTVRFTPDERAIWPEGRGQGPAVTTFTTQFTVFGCEPATVQVVAEVDTVPNLFSVCLFRWDQNEFNGYNFTPAGTRGSFVVDLSGSDPARQMITDIVYLSGPAANLSGNVRVRSGWKRVRGGVTDQNDFTWDRVRTWPEYAGLTAGGFQISQFADFELHAVYVIRVESGGGMQYALVRVREISDDGQKQKMCIDVLFPL